MKIKICGIKNICDLKYCIVMGVDYVGLNFYSKSKRFCKNGDILDNLSNIDLGNTKLVAIIVDNNEDEINEMIQKYPISILQFSGGQGLEFISKFKDKAKIIYVIENEKDADKYNNYCDILLLDASHGNGLQKDFDPINHKYAIAGGINADNISNIAKKHCNAEFLDVASGVEDDLVFSKIKLAKLIDTLGGNNFIDRSNGIFGEYGGAFIPEILKPTFDKINNAFNEFKNNAKYISEFEHTLKYYAGRETPLYYCENLTKYCGSAKIYAKREDLLHGGAHKTNNVIGQCMIAKIIDAKEVICETGAGQHGVAVSMVGAKFGFKVKVFMGAKDIVRQKANVERMKIFGAEVISVECGSKSLKDGINEAMKYWICNPDIYYIFGTAAGPHPFPQMVSYFQKVIGIETRKQILDIEGKLPSEVVACIGGGSNAIGIFQGFIGDANTRLIGIEPAGDGVKHGMSLQFGKIGCLHGSIQKVLCDNNGNIEESQSISAGLDYPGISPIHAFMSDYGLASYVGVTDNEAIEAYKFFSKMEGIIPALESSHAIAYVMKVAKKYSKDDVVIFNLSGRGDKDMDTVMNFNV
jgi:tryptophan synthase beta subunit